jgi:dienelactone hydrolase
MRSAGPLRRLAFRLLLPALIAAASLSSTPPAAAADYETVSFKSRLAAAPELSGLLLKPDGDGPFKAVIMLHGCSGMLTKSGKLKKRPTFWSQWLLARGYLVLLADSFTARGVNSICKLRDRPVTPDRDRPFDAYGALEFLQSRSDVKPDRVALIGWSNGAMTLLWTIRTNTPARPAELAHDFRAAVAFYPGCVQIDKTNFTTRIPSTIQIGDADDWTLPKPCERMVASAKAQGSPISIDLHPGAYHNFDHPDAKVKTIVTKYSVYASGEKRVHTGADPAARDKAVENVAAFLDRWLD